MMPDMSVLWPCPLSVSAYEAAGRAVAVPRLKCPSCAGPLRFDGSYPRTLSHRGRRFVLRIRRGSCRPCGRSHGLLSDFVTPRRRYCTDTLLGALGSQDDVPSSTLRDWRRRSAVNHDALAAGAAAAVVLYGGQLPNRNVGLPGLLVALHQAALRRSDLIPAPLRILNILTGGSWLSIRVEPCWAGIGKIPVTSRPP